MFLLPADISVSSTVGRLPLSSTFLHGKCYLDFLKQGLRARDNSRAVGKAQNCSRTQQQRHRAGHEVSHSPQHPHPHLAILQLDARGSSRPPEKAKPKDLDF